MAATALNAASEMSSFFMSHVSLSITRKSLARDKFRPRGAILGQPFK